MLLLALLQEPSARASEGWDYSVQAQGRSYPLGALVTGELGYNRLLWSSEPGSEAEAEAATSRRWKYGYVRPAIEASSIVLLNRADAYLELYPISILGLSAGAALESRIGRGAGAVDCAALTCDGFLARRFAKARLLLGAGPFFAGGGFLFEDITPGARSGRPFYDSMVDLAGAAGGDELVQLSAFAGYKITDAWTLAWTLSRTRMLSQAESTRDFSYLMARRKAGPWGIYGGVGAYNSPFHSWGVSLAGGVTWTGREGLSLD